MPKKQSRTEISTLEVSMIEEEGTFMTMRSSKRKYPTPTSYEAPVGLPGPSGSHVPNPNFVRGPRGTTWTVRLARRVT
jgi:hypothetical protein